MQVHIPAWRHPVFFFLSSFFSPFGVLLSSLTAGPVSFARFLRKRISSLLFILDLSYKNFKSSFAL